MYQFLSVKKSEPSISVDNTESIAVTINDVKFWIITIILTPMLLHEPF